MVGIINSFIKSLLPSKKVVIPQWEYDELLQMAYHDSLTGVLNRNGMKKLRENIKSSHQLTLIFLDIKGLHNFNKSQGHYEGDKLISYIASLFRKTDTIRWGGDEFISIEIGYIDEASLINRLEEVNRKIQSQFDSSVGIHYGYSWGSKEEFDNLLKEAESNMLSKKGIEIRI
jgi:diguanylate cyclase (GGDEF)-like protein